MTRKKLSLEDNVYYTLEDIFINADTSDLCTYAVYFMNELKEGCHYKSKMMNEYSAISPNINDQ